MGLTSCCTFRKRTKKESNSSDKRMLPRGKNASDHKQKKTLPALDAKGSGGDEAEGDSSHSSCLYATATTPTRVPQGGDSCYSSSAASSPLPPRLTFSPDAGYYSPETTLNRSVTGFQEGDSVDYVEPKSFFTPSSIAKRRPLSGSLLSLTNSSDRSDSTDIDWASRLNNGWLVPFDFETLPPKIPFGAQRVPSTVPYRDLPVIKDEKSVRSSTPASLGQSMVLQQPKKLHRSPSIDALAPKSSRHRDALSELLDLYASLGLDDDEDLLVRAERRDLPEKFQKSWSSRSSEHCSSPCESPVKRTRAPPTRRSAIPDRILDDLAARRFSAQERLVPSDYKPRGPDSIPLPKGHNLPPQSYLQLNLLFTRPMVCPCVGLMNIFNEPDVEKDDVLYRNIKKLQWKTREEQPPMGIPLQGQMPQLTKGHYLTASKREMRVKYSTRPTSTADPVQDDMAVRRLRKDTLDSSKFTQVTRV